MIKNFRIYAPLVDGSVLPLTPNTSKEVAQLITDDWGRPPQSLLIEAMTDDGQHIVINLPYDNSDRAYVRIGRGTLSPY